MVPVRRTADMGAGPDQPCERCGGETVVRPVPPGCHGVLDGDPAMIELCQRCLGVTPAPGRPATRDWDPHAVDEALPADPDAAVAVALLVTLLSSLALNRTEIEQVVDYLEAEAGVDPLLAIQRLADNDALAPAADLDRREHQLAQFLENG